MILKILLVVVVIGVVYFMFIKKKPLRNDTPAKENPKKRTKEQSNEMVECSACGTYSELGETIISNNKYYCSDECVEKA
ncbi:PP0621 family protein [Sulfurimonas sp.]